MHSAAAGPVESPQHRAMPRMIQKASMHVRRTAKSGGCPLKSPEVAKNKDVLLELGSLSNLQCTSTVAMECDGADKRSAKNGNSQRAQWAKTKIAASIDFVLPVWHEAF